MSYPSGSVSLLSWKHFALRGAATIDGDPNKRAIVDSIAENYADDYFDLSGSEDPKKVNAVWLAEL